MRWIGICSIAVAALGGPAAAQKPAQSIEVRDCSVVPAEQADILPLEAGLVQDIPVSEGQQVEKDQLLLQLDDSKAQQDQKVAEAKYKAAQLKADDDINIRYAIAAAAVAKAEYDVNKKANDDVPGAVPHVRMNELFLKCKETQLGIEKAQLDQKVAKEEATAALAEIEAAKVIVKRHRVLSPFAGVVVDIRAHKGEAVHLQQPLGLVRVARLDGKLWVEGDAPAAEFSRSDFEGKTVAVMLPVGNPLEGKITFVDAKTRQGGKFLVRAEVHNERLPNGDWRLYLFDQGLTIKVK